MLTKNAVEIAKTTKLTKEALFKILSANPRVCLMTLKAKIYSDVPVACHCYALTEPIVIYCFLKLIEQNRVSDFEFLESFENNRLGIVSEYLKEYYTRIEETQLKFWQ